MRKGPYANFQPLNYDCRSTAGLKVFTRICSLGDKEEVMVVDEPAPSRKRKADESELETREQQDSKSSKRARLSHTPADENDDDIIVL